MEVYTPPLGQASYRFLVVVDFLTVWSVRVAGGEGMFALSQNPKFFI
jgi:hypothetical protein